MLRILLILFLGVVSLSAQSKPQFYQIATPAAPGSLAPQLVTADDGEVWMSWIEVLPDDAGHRLLCAHFDAVRSRWSEAREIARGAGWTVSWADTPQLAAGRGGRLAALWYVANPATAHEHHGSYHAWISFSADGGKSWSDPVRVSLESHYNEFASLAPLGDGRWMAVWLDGRARHATPAGAQQLFARIFDDNSAQAEERLDDRVCDCCPTDVATLPDGSVYVVYRDRSDEEIRDLGGMRWRDGTWTRARGLPTDGWKIAGCPVNGPALSRLGTRLGLSWFTAAEDRPRVMAATSTDFAVRWTFAHTMAGNVAPLGRVGSVLVPDGSLWCTWVQGDGSVALSRVAPGGQVGAVHQVTPPVADATDPRHRPIGVPRLTLVARAPGATTRLLVAATTTTGEAGQTARVSTTLVTLPAAQASATLADDCGCNNDETAEGHPMRGRIVKLFPDKGSVLVAHDEIPGVMRAMTMSFRIDPRLMQFLQPEQIVLGRIARRADGLWWLFGVRIVQQPPATDGE